MPNGTRFTDSKKVANWTISCPDVIRLVRLLDEEPQGICIDLGF